MVHPFLVNLKFVLRAHILNPLWLPRDKRRNIRCVYCYRRVEALLEKYRDFVRQLKPSESDTGHDRSRGKIFSIWYQGPEKAPRLVKVCLGRLKNVYGERHIVLDGKSIFDYISLPSYIIDKWKSGAISAAHFSDICRVELLYRHGGMWFDATDYLTSPVPEWIEESDMFIYHCGEKITPQKLIQSCFMKASKGHPLFAMWREFIFEYWKREEKLVDYFLLHYMLRFLVENNEKAYNLFYAMPQVHQDPTHILWHKYCDAPYSDSLYLEATKDSFFQKTTFKWKCAENPKPGSVADFIVNDKIKIPYGETRLSDTCP